MDIAALFDVDPAKIGRRSAVWWSGTWLSYRRRVARDDHDRSDRHPEDAAQAAADALVGAGIFILNFAPAIVAVPEGVEVRQVDLALELQMLAFHETSRIAGVRVHEPVAFHWYLYAHMQAPHTGRPSAANLDVVR